MRSYPNSPIGSSLKNLMEETCWGVVFEVGHETSPTGMEGHDFLGFSMIGQDGKAIGRLHHQSESRTRMDQSVRLRGMGSTGCGEVMPVDLMHSSKLPGRVLGFEFVAIEMSGPKVDGNYLVVDVSRKLGAGHKFTFTI